MPAPIEPLQVDPVASDSAPSISSFAKLSALIPDENKLRYSTPLNLAADIEAKIEECRESETGCYMLVTGVAEEMVGAIAEEMEELGIRRAARFTYDQTMESLIVRLMPGTPHDNASWSFYFEIGDKVRNIPGHSHFSLGSVGRTAFHSPEQGEGGFEPNDARASEGEWTPLVVGVGYSGSLPALQCDAQRWLENSGGRTRMVVIIEISEHPNALRLECWEMVADPDRRVTRNSTHRRPGYNQYFDIDRAGTVTPTGHDLVIPYRTLFDTSRQGDPDIIFSAGELSEWALEIYTTISSNHSPGLD